MKKFVILLGCLILAVVVLCNPFVQWHEHQLKQAMAALQRDTVTLNEIVPFDWDKVYTFPPYTSKTEIEEKIGFRSRAIEETVSEGMVQLIFVDGDKVTASVCGYASTLGYQVEFADMVAFEEEALFSVERKDGIVCLKEMGKTFATVEEGIAYYLDEEEEVLWQDKIYCTDIAILYSSEKECISALAFAEEPEGYTEMWGLASYGSGVQLSLDAPWETEGRTPYPYYEISYTAFDSLPTEEELAESGFQEYIERDGKYFAVKLERYEMQSTATNEVPIK